MLKRFLNTARLRLFLNACRNIFNRTNSHQFLTSLACLLGVSSMVDMYTIFRLMVAICFACLVVSYFLYLSLQPFYPQQSTTSAAVVVNKETPHNSGLYSSSKSVDELNPHTYKIMAEGKNPSIILYYASWCGHCRNFVSTYNSLAAETNDRVLTLNKEKQSKKDRRHRVQHRVYPTVRFTAIDCAEYSSICSTVGISSYPTLKTYNIGASQEQVVGATAKKVSKILNEKFFKSKVGINGTESLSGVPEYVNIHKQEALSYTATPEQRWHDATMSLSFLLLTELPATWSEAQKASLMGFLKILLALYPATTGNANIPAKGLYESVYGMLERDIEPPHKFLTDKLVSLLRAAHPTHQQWEVCGVTPSSTNIPPAVTTEASQHASHSNSAGPAGSSDEPRGGHLRTAKHSGAHVLSTSASGSASTAGDSSAAVNSAHSVTSPGGATKGYTCGLWFLFHYLSVAAKSASAQQTVKAVALKESIYALVRDFFGCYDCREHFLTAYEKCDFDVCNIGDADYDKLQLWLFHQHNSVTHRVTLEDVPLMNGGGGTELDGSVVALENLWPSAQLCSNCVTAEMAPDILPGTYKTNIYSAREVLAYLQKAYLPSAQF